MSLWFTLHVYACVYAYDNITLKRDVGVGATLFPELFHFTLDPYLIMLSVKQSGTKNHLWLFRMTRPRIELRSLGPLANTLLIRPKLVLFHSFPSPWLVAKARAKEPSLTFYLLIAGRDQMNSLKAKVKSKQFRLVLEFGSPIPFPVMVTILVHTTSSVIVSNIRKDRICWWLAKLCKCQNKVWE